MNDSDHQINKAAHSEETVALESVSLDKNRLEMEIGDTATLIATFTPVNATNTRVTWNSSNTAVATVENGTVTALSAGNATITVTTESGGFTTSCYVTVNAPVLQ